MIERLNKVTVGVLAVVGVALLIYQRFTRDPITCSVPSHFSGQDARYAEKACWLSDEYQRPFDGDRDSNIVHNNRIPQRLPFLLIALAVLLYVPVIVWRFLQSNPHLPVRALVSTARQCYAAGDAQNYNHLTHFMGKTFGQYLQDVNSKAVSRTLLCKNYLTVSRILVRVLHFVASLVGVVYVLYSYSPVAMSAVIDGANTTSTAASAEPFPTVVLCEYELLRLSNVQHYTLQCILDQQLPYSVLGFFLAWLSVLCALNVLAVLCAVLAIACGCAAAGNVTSLRAAAGIDDEASSRKFVSLLGCDGAIIGRLVSEASSDAVAADMMASAYHACMQDGNAGTKPKDTAL